MELSTTLSYRQTGKATKGTLMRGGQQPQHAALTFIPPLASTLTPTSPHAQASSPARRPPAARTFRPSRPSLRRPSSPGTRRRSYSFGSRAHRFVDMENDLPGPGTYNDADKRIADDKVYSKKGLGVGFVSKTRRDSFIKAGAQGPGPGNYERGGTFAEDVKNLNRANRSGSTSTFKPPTERSVLVASDPMPGPSDYKLRRELDAHHDVTTGRPLGDSVFRSGTQRKTAGAGDPSMPGPGVYNPVLLSALDDKMTLPTAPLPLPSANCGCQLSRTANKRAAAGDCDPCRKDAECRAGRVQRAGQYLCERAGIPPHAAIHRLEYRSVR